MSDTASPQTSASPTPGVTGWPLTMVWWGDHWNRDWMEFWTGAGRIDDPARSLSEEGQAITHLMRDYASAVAAFWTFPLAAWLEAMEARKRGPEA